MPMHDWTRVSDATFHDFHYSWVLEIKRALKRGLLPPGYYVMAEQFGGDLGAPGVLTLRRSLVDCHTTEGRVVAKIEVLSPGNKASRQAVRSFFDKAVA